MKTGHNHAVAVLWICATKAKDPLGSFSTMVQFHLQYSKTLEVTNAVTIALEPVSITGIQQGRFCYVYGTYISAFPFITHLHHPSSHCHLLALLCFFSLFFCSFSPFALLFCTLFCYSPTPA